MTSEHRSVVLALGLVAAVLSGTLSGAAATTAPVAGSGPELTNVAAVDRAPTGLSLGVSRVRMAGSSTGRPRDRTREPAGDWHWPVEGARSVVVRFRAPTQPYGPGHRGVDIAAPVGAAVMAPADGVVAFRGVVVDRPLLTITHAGGLVTTFEPVDSSLSPGERVTRGQQVGTVARGGHAADGTVHLGVRLQGLYVDPLTLFGEVRRAVLLPCCRE
ncbi:murein hydrolase activator EnvC family protein [Microbacterium sp. NPDC059771]|uniref:murein hydrolase activator EnvC family protein n=1 Tax=Microbacterium TaxID=33882 RepID=UPI001FFCA75F|nr:peptidoglycan DD-metalloendopeptidase family protein [Microbacterium sufflavum]